MYAMLSAAFLTCCLTVCLLLIPFGNKSHQLSINCQIRSSLQGHQVELAPLSIFSLCHLAACTPAQLRQARGCLVSSLFAWKEGTVCQLGDLC